MVDVTGAPGAFITVDSLAAGAQLALFRQSANAPILLTGGSSGQVAIPGIRDPDGIVSDTEPANIPSLFRLQLSRNQFTDATTGLNDGVPGVYNLGIYDTDHWRCLTYPPNDPARDYPLLGIGSGTLNGNNLRISLVQCIKEECTEPIIGKKCQMCGLGMAPDNGGFYVVVSGFSGDLAALNNTYYFPACPTGQYTVSVLGNNVSVSMNLNHIGVVKLQLLDNDPDMVTDWPLVRFNPPDDDPSEGVYWCRSWNSKAMTKVTNYTQYWNQLGASPSDYANEAATVTADGIWP
jgi:hypothetical protein